MATGLEAATSDVVAPEINSSRSFLSNDAQFRDRSTCVGNPGPGFVLLLITDGSAEVLDRPDFSERDEYLPRTTRAATGPTADIEVDRASLGISINDASSELEQVVRRRDCPWSTGQQIDVHRFADRCLEPEDTGAALVSSI